MKVVAAYFISNATVRDFALSEVPAKTCVVRVQYSDWPGYLFFCRGDHNLGSTSDHHFNDWRLISSIEFYKILEGNK